MKRAVCLGLLVGACAPAELPPPQPIDLEVVVVGSSTLADAPLRIAAVWSSPTSMLVTTDVAITSTESSMQFRLTEPDDPAFIPKGFEPMTIFAGREPYLSYRPSIVAYADRDGSESFGEGDAVVGIESERTVAWLFDFESRFFELPPDFVATYYELTDQRYTPFLRAEPFVPGSFDRSVPTSASIFQSEPVLVTLGGVVRPADQLRCGNQLLYLDDSTTQVALRVDTTLDAGEMCGLEVSDCKSVPLEPIGTPVAATSDDDLVQCRKNDRAEVLVVEVRNLDCETHCFCRVRDVVTAWATSTSSAPSWWPCGRSVDFCDSSLPLYRADATCVAAP